MLPIILGVFADGHKYGVAEDGIQIVPGVVQLYRKRIVFTIIIHMKFLLFLSAVIFIISLGGGLCRLENSFFPFRFS